MDRYLLGTHALQEFLSKRDNPITQWAKNDGELFENQVYISTLSIGEIKAAWCNLGTTDTSRLFWGNAIKAGEKFFKHLGNILPITNDVTEYWVELRPLKMMGLPEGASEPVEVGEDRKLVLATAMAYNMVLVEKEQPYHDELIGRGLRILDLYKD